MKIRRVSASFLLVAAMLLSGHAGSSRAFMPQENQARYEVPLPAIPPQDLAGESSTRACSQVSADLSRRYQGHWSACAWNPQTLTPAWIYGSGVDVSPPFSDARDVASVARRLLVENAPVLRAEPENLRLASTPRASGKWAAHFQQTHAGLDVWGGKVHFTFTESGRLFVMGSTFYPGIALDPTPTLSAEQATAIARRDLPFDPATDSAPPAGELLVLPVPAITGAADYHLVWRVRVRTRDPLGIWVTHVDAHDGAVLWRYNEICFADFAGDARGPIEPHTWCNGTESQALRHMRVSVAGVGTTFTDAAGNWSLPYGGSDPREVVAELVGPYVDVRNMLGPDARYAALIPPGTPHEIKFGLEWAQQDELDCFDAVNDIHEFFMQFAPGCPTINRTIGVYVSIDGACNAYWDGAIHLSREIGFCANCGRIQGTLAHEFGHGVQGDVLGWQGFEGLGEGNADFLANLMTQESMIARGWNVNDCVHGGRDSDNDLIYPDDVIDHEYHYAGQVIAGFHWDFMTAVQEAFGQEAGTLIAARTWHDGRALEQPGTQPDQVMATFIADDDDGNLANGTPHFDFLVAAARHHNFPSPTVLTVQIEHDPLWTLTAQGGADVLANIYSLEGAMNPDSIVVRYYLNGGSMTPVRMTPTGGEQEYHAVIPDLQYGDSVAYYLRAADVLGHWATHPSYAPFFTHAFRVANTYDPLETESGWTVNLEGTDTAPRGMWVRVDPNGTIAQPEDDHTPSPGTRCWVTGNGPPGHAAGAYDVDRGVTTLCSPVYDLTGAEQARAIFWRWFSNDRDANPYEDFWGVWVRSNDGPWEVVEYTNDEDENAWVRRDTDLLAMFGEELGQVQFKFAAADTGNLSLVEAGVDDLEILARMGSAAPEHVDMTPAGFAFSGSRTMPVRGPTELSFAVPAATRVRIAVFDIGGRMVRELVDDVYGAGRHTAHWDTRDERGRALASGIYYGRMRCPGFDATRTMVLNR